MSGIPGYLDTDAQVTTAKVTTTNATVTAIHSIDLPTNFVGELSCTIVGRKSDGSDRAKFSRSMCIFRGASTPGNDTVRVVGTDYESDVSWDATITRSGNVVSITVQGAASTVVEWRARVTLVAG